VPIQICYITSRMLSSVRRCKQQLNRKVWLEILIQMGQFGRETDNIKMANRLER